jgi:hypothetical protein
MLILLDFLNKQQKVVRGRLREMSTYFSNSENSLKSRSDSHSFSVSLQMVFTVLGGLRSPIDDSSLNHWALEVILIPNRSQWKSWEPWPKGISQRKIKPSIWPCWFWGLHEDRSIELPLPASLFILFRCQLHINQIWSL